MRIHTHTHNSRAQHVINSAVTAVQITANALQTHAHPHRLAFPPTETDTRPTHTQTLSAKTTTTMTTTTEAGNVHTHTNNVYRSQPTNQRTNTADIHTHTHAQAQTTQWRCSRAFLSSPEFGCRTVPSYRRERTAAAAVVLLVSRISDGASVAVSVSGPSSPPLRSVALCWPTHRRTTPALPAELSSHVHFPLEREWARARVAHTAAVLGYATRCRHSRHAHPRTHPRTHVGTVFTSTNAARDWP